MSSYCSNRPEQLCEVKLKGILNTLILLRNCILLNLLLDFCIYNEILFVNFSVFIFTKINI